MGVWLGAFGSPVDAMGELRLALETGLTSEMANWVTSTLREE